MRPTVHMIGQAHLDPVWLWRWTEGRAEAVATSQSAADRLAEYPAFHFVRGEAQVYEWIEQENPALFARIRDLIRADRWHVVNGMVIQPDMNLPQGESFVRQALLGKSYMQQHLGVDVRVAYCVDSFGHAGTLPQILKKCGFDYFVFMRPGAHEKSLPAQAFRWRAPEGSEVLAFRIPISYTSGAEDIEKKIDDILAGLPPELADTMCFFGVGDHGGGPTKSQIEDVLAVAQRRQDVEITFSDPLSYFQRIVPQAERLPVVADELQMHAIGCYSLNSSFKRLFRQAECTLLTAERMACLSEVWAGEQIPSRELHSLWHSLSFNEFHDILAASSVKEAQDEAELALGRVIAGSREIIDNAGRQVANRVDTSGPGGTVVIFNPHPYRRQELIEYEPWTEWEQWDSANWGLVDHAGQPVPHQVIDPQSAMNCEGLSVTRLVFPVDVPPLGYRLYRFAHDLRRGRVAQQVKVRPNGLENAHLSLEINPRTGNIVSCRHKASGIELVGAGSWNVAQVLEDTSDTWSHSERAFERVLGQFGDAHVRAGEQGPLQASLFIERSWQGSTWLQQLVLRAGAEQILIRTWLLWQGRQRVVKLAFTLAAAESQAVRDVPFGSFACPTDGSEIPLQMWLDISGRGRGGQTVGLAILNDGKYGCDVNGDTARLTILRCPPYAYDRIHSLGAKLRYDWVDQGWQEFTLSLLPHVGDWRSAGIVQRARELNMPLVPITMHAHSGVLAPVNSMGALDTPEIELTALKPAEDGSGYILRLADRHGIGGRGHLSWMDSAFEVAVQPHEVKTLRLTRDGGWQATPCDMLERPLVLDKP
jgi:alpha-mannosidase